MCYSGQKVFEMPMCNMNEVLPLPTHQTKLQVCDDAIAWVRFSSSWVDVVEYGYHFTTLDALVRTNSYGLGNGILKDGGLRYGAGTHNGKRGVNFFGSVKHGYLKPGHCCLVIRCVDATRLTGGGMKTRHCVAGLDGAFASKVVPTSILFHRDDVPSMVALA